MWKLKYFKELTSNEIYEIFRARVNVFVVEQTCPYPEIDEKDLTCLHYFLTNSKGEIDAYCRIISEADNVRIGRILVSSSQRKTGLGKQLVENSLTLIREKYQQKKVIIQAQQYAEEFYKKSGFVTISDVYLEDNIPHLDMEINWSQI